MYLGQNLVHLSSSEGSAGFRLNIPHRAHMEYHRGSRFFVVGIKDQQAVVFAHGPINVPDLDAHLLGRCFDCGRTFGRIGNAFGALLGKLDGGDEGRHKESPIQ
jgi:hypothetical protein